MRRVSLIDSCVSNGPCARNSVGYLGVTYGQEHTKAITGVLEACASKLRLQADHPVYDTEFAELVTDKDQMTKKEPSGKAL